MLRERGGLPRRLAEQGLQSDARFAEHFRALTHPAGPGARARCAPSWISGVWRARRSTRPLRRRGRLVQLAAETLARRFSGPGETPKERAKRERFLAGRGFDFDQLKHALAHAWDAHDD